MGDLAVPERPDGRHAAMRDRAEAPAMPVIRPSEQVVAVPYPLFDGISPTIGWLSVVKWFGPTGRREFWPRSRAWLRSV
jgi:hypothetical protein